MRVGGKGLNRARATPCRATRSVFTQSDSGLKATEYLKKWYQNYGELNFFFQKRFVWHCSNVVQIDNMLVSVCNNASELTWVCTRTQLRTVTRLCTVVLDELIAEVVTGCKYPVAFCRKGYYYTGKFWTY